ERGGDRRLFFPAGGGREDLDRHRAPEPVVEGAVHRAHRALSEEGLNGVAAEHCSWLEGHLGVDQILYHTAVPTILVVDDDRTIREGLVRTLVASGFAARPAEGVSEARAALARGGFDGVLLDVRLKDGDGIELLAELRAAYPALP